MKNTQKLVMTTLLAALITVMTAYICHIPVGVNGGYIHFGDALIYIAASTLPLPYALLAAAIGGGLADLLTAPMWMIATIIIKMAIVFPFTSKNSKIICVRNVIAVFISGVISTVGYAVAEGLLFQNWAVSLASVAANLIQSGGSAVIFIILGFALDKCEFKSKIMR